jgi:hypothetical protein
VRKWLVVVLLCAIIVGAVIAYSITAQTRPAPKVGIFYYVWYDPSLSVSWEQPKIVDTPMLGYYNSCDPIVIRQHLQNMTELGIDFVVISWWGFYDDYGKFTDLAAKEVFNSAKEQNSTLRFAIMVEPFNKTGSSYDYTGIYNHIHADFVIPYSSVYYNETKPLVCFFNNETLTDNGTIPLDDRFNVVFVGQQNYTQWIYTDLNSYDKPSQTSRNQTSVTPRYDDSRFRKPSTPIDPDLSQGTYDQEWENAIRLWKEGKINTIMITSWNEYPESTAIEPHKDATSYNHDPNFLFNKTWTYINQVHQLTKSG